MVRRRRLLPYSKLLQFRQSLIAGNAKYVNMRIHRPIRCVRLAQAIFL